jgi:predicted CXXCH cytochrome family protein
VGAVFPPKLMRSLGVLLAAAAVLVGIGLISVQSGEAAKEPGFVGSQICGTCHAAEAKAWLNSHHAWALRKPTPDSVLGDFNDAHFEHKGVTSRFFRRDGSYFVETDGPDGKLATFEIAYVVGAAPLQQYLVELDRGRLQALDIAWDVEGKRWFHLYPNDDVRAGNGLHWTGFYKSWQARCAVCHQTDFRKNYDPQQHAYHSTWSELAVGCEACHGPGEAHVAWAKKDDHAWAADGTPSPHGLLMPKGRGKQAMTEDMCGPCHSRREDLGPDSSLPTELFADHFNLAALGNGLYFADGQQKQEVYVLGSFLQSKMHAKGVTCTNCHDPHSGGLIAEGNGICTQCHNEVGRAEFPTLKPKNYDSPEHHHHAMQTAGAACVSCHMPERTYMRVDGRRDHFFRVPDPMLSEKVGAPDACLSCHTDKRAAWAAAAIHVWDPGRSSSAASSAELFFTVRQAGLDPQTLAQLAALARNADASDIVRATAVREIGDQADPATRQSLAGLLSDNSDLVRTAAIRLWRSAPPEDRVARLQPLLSDQLRSVRVAAALELSGVAPEQLPPEQRMAFQSALDELRTSLFAKSDFPEGQMAIGGLAMTSRNWGAAGAAFAEATFMDPHLVQAWMARARIAEASGDPTEATAILSTAREKNRGDIQVATQLARLLLQQGRQADAAPVLSDIVSAEPNNLDARIALALALIQSGDLPAAADQIGFLRNAAPDTPEVLIVHALWQVASNDLAGAKETVIEIRQRYPGIPLPPALDAMTRAP